MNCLKRQCGAVAASVIPFLVMVALILSFGSERAQAQEDTIDLSGGDHGEKFVADFFLDAMVQLANANSINGDIASQYVAGRKTLLWISAGLGTHGVTLGSVTLYIDLVDYYSYISEDYSGSEEGDAGRITVWVDGSVGASASVLPVGFGICYVPFTWPETDPSRSWDLSSMTAGTRSADDRVQLRRERVRSRRVI